MRLLKLTKGIYTSITVHVAMFDYRRERTLLVHDLGGREGKALNFRGPKPERWGLVTGKTHDGETPYEAAQREFREESNILHEETSFMISALPALTKKKVSSDENKNDENEIHIEVFFIGQLMKPDTTLPEGKFPIRDPLGHVTEGCWISIFNDLPKDREEANEFCFVFDEAKNKGREIMTNDHSPWCSINAEMIIPISPPHLDFLLHEALSFPPLALQEQIPDIVRIAKETGIRLPDLSCYCQSINLLVM